MQLAEKPLFQRVAYYLMPGQSLCKIIIVMLKAISLCIAALTGQAYALSSDKIPYVERSAKVDGVLEPDVWQHALKVDINNVTWPYENQASPVTTKAYVYENGESLFIAFDANDPNPDAFVPFIVTVTVLGKTIWSV